MNVSGKLRSTGILIAFALILPLLVPAYALGATDVRRLEMGIKSVTLKVNQTKSVYVNITPSDADNKSITWSSDDSAIATVSSTGNNRVTIKAISEGKTVITATSHNGYTATCNVTVSNDRINVSRLEITPATATVRVNQIRHLFADILPVNADDPLIEWSSSNPEVVMVEADGIIVGVSPGTAIITATSDNGKTAECKVTVPSTALTGIAREVETEDIPGSQSNSGEVLNAAALRLDVENAAKAEPKARQITLTYSDKTQVSTAALRSGEFAASYNSTEARLRFRTLDDEGKIQGQMILYPKNAGKGDADILVGVYTAAAQTENVKAQAEKAFGKPVGVVWLRQQGSFGMTVQVAAKADLSGLDTKSLKIYRIADGKYNLIEDQNYAIDDVGYIHFSATDGGVYIFA